MEICFMKQINKIVILSDENTTLIEDNLGNWQRSYYSKEK